MEIYGTMGPSTNDLKTISAMIENGMTGIRLNLSHESLLEAKYKIEIIKKASFIKEKNIKFLIDLKGSELRIGKLNSNIVFLDGEISTIDLNNLYINKTIVRAIENNDYVAFDDGKILLKVIKINGSQMHYEVKRGGILTSNKSIKIIGKDIELPLFTESDLENIKHINEFNVYGVMQPFVKSRNDCLELRRILNDNGLNDVKIFAKIENRDGFNHLDEIIDVADEIIIARGDLGNAFGLDTLPIIQKEIEKKCKNKNKPFMVVTEMLKSMENSMVPTRAEVLDIFNAVIDGASSIMVTSETAIGKYPIEVIEYLKKVSDNAIKYMNGNTEYNTI